MNPTTRIRTRAPRPAVPYDTLPAPAARLTKRNLATYGRIEEVLQARDAELTQQWPGDGSINGHALRTWRLTTSIGALEVTPMGAWVACRAEDPAALARIVGTLPVNLYSGKWNHHFWSDPLEWAVESFAREIDRVIGAGWSGCVAGAGGCGCIALAVGGAS